MYDIASQAGSSDFLWNLNFFLFAPRRASSLFSLPNLLAVAMLRRPPRAGPFCLRLNANLYKPPLQFFFTAA